MNQLNEIKELKIALDQARRERDEAKSEVEKLKIGFEIKIDEERFFKKAAERERDKAREAAKGCWLWISHGCSCPALAVGNTITLADQV